MTTGQLILWGALCLVIYCGIGYLAVVVTNQDAKHEAVHQATKRAEDEAIEQRRQTGLGGIASPSAPPDRRPPRYQRRHGPPTYPRRRRTRA